MKNYEFLEPYNKSPPQYFINIFEKQEHNAALIL